MTKKCYRYSELVYVIRGVTVNVGQNEMKGLRDLNKSKTVDTLTSEMFPNGNIDHRSS